MNNNKNFMKKNMNFKSKLIVAIGLGIGVFGYSQSNFVYTGAPFLRISPDARAGGMGDQGVATSTDGFSQFWNAAKYPFARNMSSASISYTPWMGKLVNDTFLLYGAYSTFLGEEQRSTLSASIYYFNMGEVALTSLRADGTGFDSNGVVKPNEFAIDLSYALRLADTFSMAVTGRYIRSDFGNFNSDNTMKPANTFAIDVAGYYQSLKHASFGEFDGRLRGGFAISNIGPKLDYTGDEANRSYLPTMARLGLGYDIFFDEQNRLSFTGEASKLLVPGITEISRDALGNVTYGTPNVGVVEGMGKSFSNKKSMMYSGAVEYSYDEAFSLRGGYFHESPEQGSRQYATAGVGFKYQSFGLDISYLINTSKVNSALDNTLRFGLTWNIGSETDNAQR